MMYARCKCGEYEVWTSMGVKRCSWCKKCETTPAYGKDGHKFEQPKHKMKFWGDEKMIRAYEAAKVTEIALRGKPEHLSALGVIETLKKDMNHCWYCLKTERDLAAIGEPMDFTECVTS